MNGTGEFYHSLSIDAELCIGCAHCVRKCPTHALRIRNGKASIRKSWCVDCGECLKACPVKAIYVEQDDFDKILGYRCKVALVPSVFLGQFPETDSEEDIFRSILNLGFTHICPVELTTDIIRQEMEKQIKSTEDKPAISPFCPSIVRLIQTRFPDLIDNIINVKTPIEATAFLYRNKLIKEGYASGEIGIFYVTPCAAKAASIRNGDNAELIDGILNLDSLFNKVCLELRNKSYDSTIPLDIPAVSSEDMSWSRTDGEAGKFNVRSFAIDDIHNVIEFIERLDITNDLNDIDFLELRACNRSCMGGSLTPANRFLAAERVQNRSLEHPTRTRIYDVFATEQIESLKVNINRDKPAPMTKLMYRGDINEVLCKMDMAKQIETSLPGIDCGACGSPTCRSLSEDIVREEADIAHCIFMQRMMEQSGEITKDGSARILKEVWGSKILK